MSKVPGVLIGPYTPPVSREGSPASGFASLQRVEREGAAAVQQFSAAATNLQEEISAMRALLSGTVTTYEQQEQIGKKERVAFTEIYAQNQRVVAEIESCRRTRHEQQLSSLVSTLRVTKLEGDIKLLEVRRDRGRVQTTLLHQQPETRSRSGSQVELQGETAATTFTTRSSTVTPLQLLEAQEAAQRNVVMASVEAAALGLEESYHQLRSIRSDEQHLAELEKIARAVEAQAAREAQKAQKEAERLDAEILGYTQAISEMVAKLGALNIAISEELQSAMREASQSPHRQQTAERQQDGTENGGEDPAHAQLHHQPGAGGTPLDDEQLHHAQSKTNVVLPPEHAVSDVQDAARRRDAASVSMARSEQGGARLPTVAGSFLSRVRGGTKTPPTSEM